MKRDNLLVRNEVILIGFRGGLGKKTFTTVVFHLGTNQNVCLLIYKSDTNNFVESCSSWYMLFG